MFIIDAIITYIVILVVSFFIMTYILGYHWWSALVMSLIISMLALLAIFPLWDLKNESLSIPLMIYLFILALSLVIIILYVFTKALIDFVDCDTIYKFMCCKKNNTGNSC